MSRPTRFYSKEQEKRVAKAVGGKRTANSGATAFSKGDVRTDLFLLECKTCTEPRKSISIKKEWFDKNKEREWKGGFNDNLFDMPTFEMPKEEEKDVSFDDTSKEPEEKVASGYYLRHICSYTQGRKPRDPL